MQQKILFHKFSSALSWNAFLYVAHRILSTTLVFVLYRSVPPDSFSLWAALSSIVYLSLLWLDFGFRKSIARYAPVFTAHGSFVLFTRTVLIFQVSVLLLALPLFSYILPHLFVWIVHREPLLSGSLRLIGSLLFVTEGLTEILRLLYHAHFLNKPFNLLYTAARLIESITSILLITHLVGIALSSSQLIVTLLWIKFFSGLLIIVVALGMLPRLYRVAQHDIPKEGSATNASLRPVWYGFMRHSLLMWISNILKSLSERNFIVPLLTHVFGPIQANLFKISQDGALFFERSIIKTLGTADTALLAHAASSSSVTQQQTFMQLSRRVAGLCVALLSVLLFLFLLGYSYVHSLLFQLFLIMTASYLIEVLLSPYERLLEVKLSYWLLYLAYAPYVVGLAALFFGITHGFVESLVWVTVALQMTRLVSSCLMVWFVHRYYKLSFPVLFTVGWLMVGAGCAVGGWLVTGCFIDRDVLHALVASYVSR